MESNERNILVLLLLLVSTVIALYAFKPQLFNFTAKISKQMENYEKDNYLIALIKTKTQAFNSNLRQIKEIHHLLWLSSSFLVSALVVQLLLILKILCF
jgi:hypothetical protein